MANILLAVTGSIAAYKSAEIIRAFKKQGDNVRVIATQSATKIITPMTLQVLSQNPVRVDLFDQEQEGKIDHIDLARWPDCILIAPATANSLAKIALGLADDLLSTICLATDKPILFAPAMNQQMWKSPIIQQHINTLQLTGHLLINPNSGEQACGETGYGRLAEPSQILTCVNQYLANKTTESINKNELLLNGKNLLITAGATIERIDPVRYLSNDSSGKMGYAIAETASILGAKVTLVSGKTELTPPQNVHLVSVSSAQEMHDQVISHIHSADWFIATAAVADYRVKSIAAHKIKKEKEDELTIQLVKNTDILQSVASLSKKPFCIGFAAETQNIIDNAKAKRINKNIDLIAANDVSDKSIGFNGDHNAITLIGNKFQQVFPFTDKHTLSKQLLLACLDYYNNLSN